MHQNVISQTDQSIDRPQWSRGRGWARSSIHPGAFYCDRPWSLGRLGRLALRLGGGRYQGTRVRALDASVNAAPTRTTVGPDRARPQPRKGRHASRGVVGAVAGTGRDRLASRLERLPCGEVGSGCAPGDG